MASKQPKAAATKPAAKKNAAAKHRALSLHLGLNAVSGAAYGGWTGPLFNLMRLFVRVMIIDCHEELQEAWVAIRAAGGPEACPDAMAELRRLPFSYADAFEVNKKLATNKDAVQLAREWAAFFRDAYAKAARAAAAKSRS